MALFIICKDTKFQSNSQHLVVIGSHHEGCFSSAKIQNFKAIHNPLLIFMTEIMVVYHLQRYKISKQFTTFQMRAGDILLIAAFLGLLYLGWRIWRKR